MFVSFVLSSVYISEWLRARRNAFIVAQYVRPLNQRIGHGARRRVPGGGARGTQSLCM